MNHIIVGTAGHIDHGKTALVKALSGIECDTHREEKRRGITINLGFAHLSLPDGTTVGIVDVPGHRDFIHTMVSGASGIDVAMLVVAADGGIMPQTREHMHIMSMLGVKKGLVAVTRTDLVDEELCAMAVEEVGLFVKGSFLDGCPVVAVSSKTGEGIQELKEALVSVTGSVEGRKNDGLFRMYIDRIFSVSGFGTVVTGSVLGGRAEEGEQLYLLPGGKKVRIRRCERHGAEVKEVVGGDRASLNLVGISREEFRRGMMLADRELRPTRLIDARVELFEQTRELPLWTKVQFYLGTYEAQARMHMIDTDTLRPGEQGIVQLHLPEECIAQAGDRFVLRSSSDDETLGGGSVIDAAPLHHRRRPSSLVEKLYIIAEGSLADLIAAEVRKHPGGISSKELAASLNRSSTEILEARNTLPDNIVPLVGGKETFYIGRREYDGMGERIVRAIAAHHRRNPLDPSGRTIEELQGMLGLTGAEYHSMVLIVCEQLKEAGKLRNAGHTWVLDGHDADNAEEYREMIDAVDRALASFGLKAPLDADLDAIARNHNIDGHFFRQILNRLVAAKRLYLIEGTYLHSDMVDPIRCRLGRALKENQDGFTVAGFRDLIGGNRKICLLLYALFDREGFTERNGDVRLLTAEGARTLSACPDEA
jgi:selenocysteine-specific elongation factor